jgi:TPR repeat protein
MFSTIPVFVEGDNLGAFVERARPHLEDPRTMYYVSQALEECYAWGGFPDDDDLYAGVNVISHVDLQQAKRSWASETLSAPCRGLERKTIDPREILTLLEKAARQGEPHARAHILVFRDVAAPKFDAIPELPDLLATGDPQIVRDVGAFLTRGEISLRYGGEEIEAPVAAIAWELAACDLGYPCGPMSRLVLTACAYRGYCDDYLYDNAIARDEGPDRMARAQRLRSALVLALRRQDWAWLGLFL